MEIIYKMENTQAKDHNKTMEDTFKKLKFIYSQDKKIKQIVIIFININ